MDVRAKQRLCYRVAWFPLACVQAVSPHVISTVSRLLVKLNETFRRDVIKSIHLWRLKVKSMSNKLKIVKELKIERPPRAEVTEQQALKRMKEFAEKRKEKFIGTVRKNKSRNLSS